MENDKMKVDEHKQVSIIYTMRFDSEDGEIIEEIQRDRALEYIHGVGRLLPQFETNLEGLAVNDKFKFKLDCDAAFGPYNKELIRTFSRDEFKEYSIDFDDPNILGQFMLLNVEPSGQQQVRILEVDGNKVKLDFNHILAGRDVFVNGEVVNLREATLEELTGMHGCCGGHGHGDCHDGHGHGHGDCGCHDGHGHDGHGHGHGGCGCGCDEEPAHDDYDTHGDCGCGNGCC